MSKQQASTALRPIRLPALPKLRVKRPNAPNENPCLAIMSSMLSCWAASSSNPGACAGFEQQLRVCMDQKRPNTVKRNTINYHMMRLYPKIKMPSKRNK